MSKEQLLEAPPGIEEGESEESRDVRGLSWDDVLEVLGEAAEAFKRLRLELAKVCSLLQFDYVYVRDRRERGKGIELRVCTRDGIYGPMRCKHFYLSRKRLEQLEKLGIRDYDYNTLRKICELLGLRREPPEIEEGGDEEGLEELEEAEVPPTGL